MMNAVLIGCGGAFGALMRYYIAVWVAARFGGGFPYGTLSVNALGGFAIGALVPIIGNMGSMAEPMRLLLIVGVLGGFTTFSAFTLEVLQLWGKGAVLTAGIYVAVSVIGCVTAASIGMTLSKRIVG